MKICVIFTGGTIGSRTSGEVVELGSAPYSLLEGLDLGGNEIVTYEPYSILSEELGAHELGLLADCIRKNMAGCGAVIVTHGTDSLVYTAAFLSYAFAEAGVPIYLVSSGYPLDDVRANGRENFSAAVNSALAGELGGVNVVWTAGGETRFCPGARVLRQRPYDDMVEYVDGCGSECAAPPFAGESFGFGNVLFMKALPSMYYPLLDKAVRGVLIESYHSGTLCADERFAEFMKRADSLGIPVFIAGTGGRDADYETTAKYKALGAVPLYKSSPDVMYVKLCLATAHTSDTAEVKKLMLTPFADDCAE